MHVTLVHVRVVPERVADFIAASTANHEGAILEPGNVRFDILQAENDPTHFILYEAYETAEAASAHKGTPHYQRWKDAVAPWMAEPRHGEVFIGLVPGSGRI